MNVHCGSHITQICLSFPLSELVSLVPPCCRRQRWSSAPKNPGSVSQRERKDIPFGSCPTRCGICGLLCNSSGRELKGRKEKKKLRDSKSSHREFTCLSVSLWKCSICTLMSALCSRGPFDRLDVTASLLVTNRLFVHLIMGRWCLFHTGKYSYKSKLKSASAPLSLHIKPPHLQSSIREPGGVFLEVCEDTTWQFLIINTKAAVCPPAMACV